MNHGDVRGGGKIKITGVIVANNLRILFKISECTPTNVCMGVPPGHGD